MFMFKRAVLAVLVMGSGISFAGVMGAPCMEGSVTVPCEHASWDVSAKALYLQTTGSSDNYQFDTISRSGVNQFTGIPPNWNWGFMVEGSYHYLTGNDFTANWYHYSNSAKNETQSLIKPSGAPLPTSLSTTHNTTWNAGNVELGQSIHFGPYKALRVYGGAQVAKLILDASGTNAFLPAEQFSTSFDGVGPRFGADFSYITWHGFSLYANAATAVLIGHSKFNYSAPAISGFTLGPSTGTILTIIPELEAKLGIKYAYSLPWGSLSIDAGYMWLDYIKAYGWITPVNTNSSSDFGLNGGYFGLKWWGSIF